MAILSKKILLEIEEIINKFPVEHKQAAVVEVLIMLQKQHNGYLTKELLDAVAAYLMIPKITVYEVANFYNKFRLRPVGKYEIAVCTNISCMLGGCKKISKHVKKKLQINFGGITNDLKFSLKEVGCVASCDQAPIVQINQQQFNKINIELLDHILENLP